MRFRVLAIALSFVSAATSADVIHVPADQPTIQDGLNLAQTGDTVLVAAGEYSVDILSWPNRNGISLIGAGLDSTVVSGDGWQSVIYITNSTEIDSLTRIQGLTFRNGGDAGLILFGASPDVTSCQFDSTAAGPGVYAVASSAARFENCIMQDNNGPGVRTDGVGRMEFVHCEVVGNYLLGNRHVCRKEYPEGHVVRDQTDRGGGFHFDNESSPVLVDCTIAENVTNGGGGIYCDNGSNPVFYGCTISENYAGDGGGLLCYVSEPEFYTCTISANTATASGGGGRFLGFYGIAYSAVFDSCTIMDNIANRGGGVYCDGCEPVFSGCEIIRNSANIVGGGLVFSGNSGEYSYPMLNSCTVAGNSAEDGGGIYCYNDQRPQLYDCTLSGNLASAYGGGLYCRVTSYPTLSGCAVLENYAEVGGGMYCEDESDAILLSCLVFGNVASIGGGVYSTTSIFTCSDSQFWCNEATHGGAVFCFDSEASIVSTDFSSNRGLIGGAMNLCEVTGLVEYCSFSFNAADSLGDAMFTENVNMPIMECNYFVNGWGIHNNSPTAVPHALFNWWGAYSGPWHQSYNPSGDGDSLSVYAWDFIPWREEASTVAPPFPPRGLSLNDRESGGVSLIWEPLPLSDLAGYRVHYDADSLGFDYDGVVDVGNETSVFLGGLDLGTGYRIAVSSYDIDGNSSSPGRAIWVVAEPVGVPESAPNGILTSNYPNPFNPSTSIHFTLAETSHVTLSVYDLAGRRICDLHREELHQGDHEVSWNGVDELGNPVPSGIYLYRLEVGDHIETGKMTLLK